MGPNSSQKRVIEVYESGRYIIIILCSIIIGMISVKLKALSCGFPGRQKATTTGEYMRG